MANNDPDKDLGAARPHQIEPFSYGMLERAKEIIKAAQTGAARSMQKAAGPSEIGNPCERALGYKATQFKQVNYLQDGWQATVGTATHAWLAEAFEKANGNGERFLIEFRIGVVTPEGIEIPGTLDIYDRAYATLIDWKIVGKQSMRRYSYSGSPVKYQTQAMIYGLGLELKGERPERVGNIFLPSEGKLADAVPWSAPYDRSIAEKALKRYGEIHVKANELVGPEKDYSKLSELETVTSNLCSYCAFYKPDAPSTQYGCRGPLEEADFGGLI